MEMYVYTCPLVVFDERKWHVAARSSYDNGFAFGLRNVWDRDGINFLTAPTTYDFAQGAVIFNRFQKIVELATKFAVVFVKGKSGIASTSITLVIEGDHKSPLGKVDIEDGNFVEKGVFGNTVFNGCKQLRA